MNSCRSLRALLVATAMSLAVGAAVADDFYVDAASGSDSTGDGSAASPWQTIGWASWEVWSSPWSSDPYDTIWVAPGVYDEALGEVFPIYIALDQVVRATLPGTAFIRPANGRSGVLLGGHDGSRCASVLDMVVQGAAPGDPPAGRGVDIGCFGSGIPVGARVAGNRIEGFEVGIQMRIQWDALGIFTPPTRLYFEGNEIRRSTVGIDMQFSAIQTEYAVDDTSVIRNNVIEDADVGIQIDSSCFDCVPTSVDSLVVNNTIANTTGSSIVVGGADGAHVQPTIVNNVLSTSGGYGIDDPVVSFGDPVRIGANDFWANVLGDMRRGVNRTPDNLFSDPQFVDAASGDLHLVAGSPCIDAADEAAAPPIDREGRARPIDGDGDSNAVSDIGAYEFRAELSVRRADFADIGPPRPSVSAAYPFEASNPRTPVILADLVSGDTDPTPGILSSEDIPLAFYQIDPGTAIERLYLTKDTVTDSVALAFE